MLDQVQWGNVAEWTGALLTGLSVLGAATFYVVDRLRDRRGQAGSVVVWLHPHEHGPPMIKMSNHSDKPIFDHGFLITAKSTRQIVRLARKGWAHQWGPYRWPEFHFFRYHDRRTLLNFHDGSELLLASGESAEFQPELEFRDLVYDYYAYFRDVYGHYWVVDARTQRPVSEWKRRRLAIGPAGLDST